MRQVSLVELRFVRVGLPNGCRVDDSNWKLAENASVAYLLFTYLEFASGIQSCRFPHFSFEESCCGDDGYSAVVSPTIFAKMIVLPE